MDRSDKALVDFLEACDAETLWLLICQMRSQFSPCSKAIAKRYRHYGWLPGGGTEARTKLAKELADLLRWYGSNTAAYELRNVFATEPGVHFLRVVRDVARVLNKRLPRRQRVAVPRGGTLTDYEDIVVGSLLKATVEGKTREEIAEMFVDAGLAEDAALEAARRFGPGAGAGLALPVLVRILGKKTVKTILEQLLYSVTYKTLGKQGAAIFAKRLLLKVPQKVVSRFISVIGWILLTTDVLALALAPAKRITIPVVATISALRVRTRLAGDAE